jgi:branched-chain amino acid transport system substrate-binding protein
MAAAAIEAHKAAYGEDPGAFFLNAYSAALALLNAIEKAGAEGINKGKMDYNAITTALRTEYVDTPLGKIRFDKNGDATGVGFSMYRVKNGAYYEVK